MTQCKIRRHTGGVDVWLHAFLTSVIDGQLHAPLASILRKGPQYPLNRELGGVHSQYRRFEEEKNMLTLPRIEDTIKIITYFCIAAPCIQ